MKNMLSNSFTGDIKRLSFLVSVFILLPLSLAANDKTIPLLICEHHADHMVYFFRHGDGISATMLVLDSHNDTIFNEYHDLIGEHIKVKNYSQAAELAGNHNWIHPLTPVPVETLVWTSTLSGNPVEIDIEGFNNSTYVWGNTVRAITMSVDELMTFEINGEFLFVSIDLDFFFENYGTDDVHSVLELLFSYSLKWSGPVVWAICLSRPWLPNDDFAWALLETTFKWLYFRSEFFNIEIIDLFDSIRIDTSQHAQTFIDEGLKMPILHEADASESIKLLIQKLLDRN